LKVPSISDDAWRVVRMNNGEGLQFVEDMPLPAFVASMIAGLPYAAQRVDGVDVIIDEALDILNDMNLPQLTEEVKERQWPESFKEFLITESMDQVANQPTTQ
jgi:hypothetical protein